MTFGERIKKLRKALDLTQQEFADRIGSKRNTVATYEMGRTDPSAAVVSLICREFKVSEEWLRTGIGEMFQPKAEDTLEELLGKRNITDSERILLKNFLAMSDSARQEVIAFVSKCVQELAEVGQAEPVPAVQAWAPADGGGQDRTGVDTGGETRPRYYVPTDEDIEREVEDFRRRLILEKRQAGEPSPSSEDGETA